MVKKIQALLLCTSALLSTSSFATNFELSKGISKEYDLPPGQVQTLSNYLPWTVTATCKVRTEKNAKSAIYIEALQKKVIVNGFILTEGETLKIVVSPNEKIEIEADAHAQAYLTNQSDQLVNLHCSTK
ncbi:hypothetical protein ACNVED_12440 [Legionella sp. D16C41]|uniref:hypothetical protein n=1 Tax=Legionella sp. D16C41 TaxID=3402688 RepID=UPI003AF93092